MSGHMKPWEFEADETASGQMFGVFNEHGVRVTDPYISEQDAQRIVTAVNCHDDLLAALAFYAQGSRYEGPNQRPIDNDPYAGPNDSYRLDVTRDGGSIARFALAKAKGESR